MQEKENLPVLYLDFGNILLKISSILTLLFVFAREGNLPVLHLDFGNTAKNIFKTDPSFSVCRRRNLPVLYLYFWKNFENGPQN